MIVVHAWKNCSVEINFVNLHAWKNGGVEVSFIFSLQVFHRKARYMPSLIDFFNYFNLCQGNGNVAKETEANHFGVNGVNAWKYGCIEVTDK